MPRAIRVLVAVFLLVLTFGPLPAHLLLDAPTPVFASEMVSLECVSPAAIDIDIGQAGTFSESLALRFGGTGYSADAHWFGYKGGGKVSVAAATARSGVIATAGSLSGASTSFASIDDTTTSYGGLTKLESWSGHGASLSAIRPFSGSEGLTVVVINNDGATGTASDDISTITRTHDAASARAPFTGSTNIDEAAMAGRQLLFDTVTDTGATYTRTSGDDGLQAIGGAAISATVQGDIGAIGNHLASAGNESYT